MTAGLHCAGHAPKKETCGRRRCGGRETATQLVAVSRPGREPISRRRLPFVTPPFHRPEGAPAHGIAPAPAPQPLLFRRGRAGPPGRAARLLSAAAWPTLGALSALLLSPPGSAGRR